MQSYNNFKLTIHQSVQNLVQYLLMLTSYQLRDWLMGIWMCTWFFILDEEIDVELDENYINRRHIKVKEAHQSPIDVTTTYFKRFDVTDECLMHEFGMKHFPDYNPEDGFGFFKMSGDDSKSIPPEKQVIIMDEVYIYTQSHNLYQLSCLLNFNRAYQNSLHSVQLGSLVYVIFMSKVEVTQWDYLQALLFCFVSIMCTNIIFPLEHELRQFIGACSKDITSTTFWKVYDVSLKCKETDFAENNIPKYTPEWSCYCYFEFTKAEYIKPHQHIIVLMKVRRTWQWCIYVHIMLYGYA